jgi:hypothetical protein
MPEYWENPTRPTQIRAFAQRAGIAIPETFPDDCARTLHAFLWPLLDDVRTGKSTKATWAPGGPWK